jgi:hypothetical protein
MPKFQDFLRSVSPAGQAKAIRIRETPWSKQDGATLAKKWGVSGVLDSGDELVVIIDVTFSRSPISGQVDPHIFIFLHPNVFDLGERFIHFHLASPALLADASLMSARTSIAKDGSIIISPTDRVAADSVFEVLSDEPSICILLLVEAEPILRVTLPNNAQEFIEVAKKAISI